MVLKTDIRASHYGNLQCSGSFNFSTFHQKGCLLLLDFSPPQTISIPNNIFFYAILLMPHKSTCQLNKAK